MYIENTRIRKDWKKWQSNYRLIRPRWWPRRSTVWCCTWRPCPSPQCWSRCSVWTNFYKKKWNKVNAVYVCSLWVTLSFWQILNYRTIDRFVLKGVWCLVYYLVWYIFGYQMNCLISYYSQDMCTSTCNCIWNSQLWAASVLCFINQNLVNIYKSNLCYFIKW